MAEEKFFCEECGSFFGVDTETPPDHTSCRICNTEYYLNRNATRLRYFRRRGGEVDIVKKGTYDLHMSPSGRLNIVEAKTDGAPSDISTFTAAKKTVRLKPNLYINRKKSVSQESSPHDSNTSDFQVLRRIGQGGMGTIYSARQLSVERNIAIKMISPEMAKDQSVRDAFLREAKVTGSLDHPNIVTVHDAGESQDGTLFYAMREIQGAPWSKLIKNKSDEENIEILIKVCDAVAFAHDKGIIHRDIKPDNVMLGSFGEVFLMDWGLAASVEKIEGVPAAIDMNEESCASGTPAYMAPEMLGSDISKIGFASDIYLLGAVLFEIITGLKAHRGDSKTLLQNAILNNEIQHTNIKGEHIEIALKAMNTDPEERYKSVKEFQTALKDYLSHLGSIRLSDQGEASFLLAVSSQSYTEFAQALFAFRESARLWSENENAVKGIRKTAYAYASCAYRRGDYDLAISLLDPENPKHQNLIGYATKDKQIVEKRARKIRVLSWSMGILLAVLLVILSIASLTVWNSEKKAIASRDRAVKGEAMAVASEQRIRDLLIKNEKENYLNSISLAESRILDNSSEEAAKILAKLPSSLRSWEWGFMMKSASLPLKTIKSHNDSIYAIAFSDDSLLAASAGNDRILKIYKGATLEPIRSFEFSAPPRKIAFSPDSSKILCITLDGAIQVISTDNWQNIFSINANGESLSAYFPADGRTIMIAGGKNLCIYDAATGKMLVKNENMQSKISSISPCGKDKTALLGADGAVYIAENQTGKIESSLKLEHPILQMTASASSGRIAMTSKDGEIIIRKQAGNEKTIRTPYGQISAISFSADGSKLIACGANAASIYECASGRELKSIKDPSGGDIYSARFSPDMKHFITGGGSNALAVWDLKGSLSGTKFKSGLEEDSMQTVLTGSPDASVIYSGSASGDLSFIEAGSGRVIRNSKLSDSSISALSASPDGSRLAAATVSGEIIVLNPSNGEELLRLKDPSKTGINSLLFSSDSRTLISAWSDAKIRTYEINTGSVQNIWGTHDKAICSLSLSPDGKTLASAGWDGSVILRDFPSGRVAGRLEPENPVPLASVSFSGDGSCLVTAGSDSTATVWDVAAQKIRGTIKDNSGQINSAVFTRDAKRLITSNSEKNVKLWDMESGRELVSLKGDFTGSATACFLSGGRTLAVQSENASVTIFETVQFD